MIKQAKAGKPIDVDAIPPPVATGASKPSAPSSSPPIQPAAAQEDQDTSNKATPLEQTAQDGMSKLLQDGEFIKTDFKKNLCVCLLV